MVSEKTSNGKRNKRIWSFEIFYKTENTCKKKRLNDFFCQKGQYLLLSKKLKDLCVKENAMRIGKYVVLFTSYHNYFFVIVNCAHQGVTL